MKTSSYKNTWSPLRIEVAKACNELDLDIRPLDLNEWKSIEEKIFGAFCHRSYYKNRPVWLWNALKADAYSVLKEQPIKELPHVVEAGKNVYLMLEETVNESTKYWYYEGEIMSICKLLNVEDKVFVNEICVVSKKYDWLLCINHHSCLIAAGDMMINKLKALR